MTIASGMIELQFYQGPIDGWFYSFDERKVPYRIQFICESSKIKTRYAIYILNIKEKKYIYVGSSRKVQKSIPIVESVITRPFYVEKGKRFLLQEWVPVSSLKEGN